MSKIITSPVLEFPGTITLSDKPGLPMVELFLEARFMPRDTLAHRQERNDALFATVTRFVEKWDIKGQPETVTRENIVATPFLATQELISWLVEEVYNLCIGERIVPKVSEPEPIATPATPATIASQQT